MLSVSVRLDVSVFLPGHLVSALYHSFLSTVQSSLLLSSSSCSLTLASHGKHVAAKLECDLVENFTLFKSVVGVIDLDTVLQIVTHLLKCENLF